MAGLSRAQQGKGIVTACSCLPPHPLAARFRRFRKGAMGAQSRTTVPAGRPTRSPPDSRNPGELPGTAPSAGSYGRWGGEQVQAAGRALASRTALHSPSAPEEPTEEGGQDPGCDLLSSCPCGPAAERRLAQFPLPDFQRPVGVSQRTRGDGAPGQGLHRDLSLSLPIRSAMTGRSPAPHTASPALPSWWPKECPQ